MRKVLFLALFFATSKHSIAQQLHFTSIFQQHNSMYNPGAAGFTGKTVIGTTYRSMWSAFSGSPRTFMVYADVPWDKKNAAIGGYLYRDVTGPLSKTGLQAVVSYHVKTGEKSKIGLGLELRGIQYSVDKSKIVSAVGDDPVFAASNTKFNFDMGAGIYYTDGKLSAGAAVSQLIQSKLSFTDIQNAKERAKLYRHFVVNANYVIQAGDNTHLIPNAMLRYIPNTPLEFDFGCKVDVQDRMWMALSWRVAHFWSVQAGVRLFDQLDLAYAYDYYNSPFSDYNSGNNAHELGLRFSLKKNTKK